MRNQTVIRTLIREMLKESVGDQPAGATPMSLNLSIDNIGIVTVQGSFFSKLTVVYSIPELYRLARWYSKKLASKEDKKAGHLVISGLEWGEPDTGGPPCNGAHVVRRAVTAFPGAGRWGQVAYVAALDEIKELGPDRGEVRTGAEHVWEKLATGKMGVSVEMKPYVNYEDHKGSSPKNACVIHAGRPFLNASYRLVGSTPSEILLMKRRGNEHLNNVRELYGASITKKLQSVLYAEFNAVFENAYG